MLDRNSVTIIDENSVIRGNLKSNSNLRVNGRVMGNIVALGRVVIGENGFVEGNIAAHELEIIGEVIGNLKVKDTLTLKPTARVLGDIEVMYLVIEKGAKHVGGCKMELDMANAIPEYSSEEIKLLAGSQS
ncbi:MAG: polymer-forming cytoskeletal protein [Bacteroidia bacterium]|nr:polymer-forming cytoskeletal protein [Bacteroidia bacterium]